MTRKRMMRFLATALGVCGACGVTAASAQTLYMSASALQWTYEEAGAEFEAIGGQAAAGLMLGPSWGVESRFAGGGNDSAVGSEAELDWVLSTLLRPTYAVHEASANLYALVGVSGFRMDDGSGGGYAALEASYGAGFEWRVSPEGWMQFEYLVYSGSSDNTLQAASLGLRWMWE